MDNYNWTLVQNGNLTPLTGKMLFLAAENELVASITCADGTASSFSSSVLAVGKTVMVKSAGGNVTQFTITGAAQLVLPPHRMNEIPLPPPDRWVIPVTHTMPVNFTESENVIVMVI